MSFLDNFRKNPFITPETESSKHLSLTKAIKELKALNFFPDEKDKSALHLKLYSASDAISRRRGQIIFNPGHSASVISSEMYHHLFEIKNIRFIEGASQSASQDTNEQKINAVILGSVQEIFSKIKNIPDENERNKVFLFILFTIIEEFKTIITKINLVKNFKPEFLDSKMRKILDSNEIFIVEQYFGIIFLLDRWQKFTGGTQLDPEFQTVFDEHLAQLEGYENLIAKLYHLEKKPGNRLDLQELRVKLTKTSGTG
jgi:hypothetical protein